LIGCLDQLTECGIFELKFSHGLFRGWPCDCGTTVGILLVVGYQSRDPVCAFDHVRMEVVRVIDVVREGGSVGADFAFFGVPVDMSHFV
jgi:hypothetical protein